MTYRAELSGRALKQMHGLPGSAFGSLIETMADVIDYPDDPLRTFPTSDPYVRRVEFGLPSGLICGAGCPLVIVRPLVTGVNGTLMARRSCPLPGSGRTFTLQPT